MVRRSFSRLGSFLLDWLWPFALCIGLVATTWLCWQSLYRLPRAYDALEERGERVSAQPRSLGNGGRRPGYVLNFEYRLRRREIRVFDNIDQFQYYGAFLEAVPVLVDPQDPETAFTAADVRERTNSGFGYVSAFGTVMFIYCLVSLVREIAFNRWYKGVMARSKALE